MTDKPGPMAPADHEPLEPMACCGRERDKDGGPNPHCECPAPLGTHLRPHVPAIGDIVRITMVAVARGERRVVDAGDVRRVTGVEVIDKNLMLRFEGCDAAVWCTAEPNECSCVHAPEQHGPDGCEKPCECTWSALSAALVTEALELAP